jgi:DNA-binding LytR/AlgR family response regulator
MIRKEGYTNILIVEDEILIQLTIKKYLEEYGYSVFLATSFTEAITILEKEVIDLAILDIHIKGDKNGIDISNYLKNKSNIPFLFLTAHMDADLISKAKENRPKAYLLKPIRQESLYASIEMILHEEKSDEILLKDGLQCHRVKLNDILYVKSDHVYLNVFLENKKQPLVVRISLTTFKENYISEKFIQPHRSYLVNTLKIDGWNHKEILVNGHQIPISKKRKEEISKALDS